MVTLQVKPHYKYSVCASDAWGHITHIHTMPSRHTTIYGCAQLKAFSQNDRTTMIVDVTDRGGGRGQRVLARLWASLTREVGGAQ